MLAQNTFGPDGFNNQLPCPSQGKLRAGYFKGLTNLVLLAGGDPVEVLTHEGIDPKAFDDPDYEIECLTAVNLLEHCSKSLRDPFFGLHLAEYQDPDVYGCVMVLAAAAPNLRKALECFVEFVPISASPECEMELVTVGRHVEIRFHTHIGLGDKQQVYYHGLLLTMKVLQMLGKQHFKPSYATIGFDIGHQEARLLQEKLGCIVHGAKGINAIAFPVDMLDQPIATANRMLFSILGNGLAQLRTSSRADGIEQVESVVRRAISSGHCSIDKCADILGTSARTLQKRLTRLGVKFSTIVQEERIKLAKQALLWSDCSLDEIAFQLGYSEQTSFGRAFKRSTGMTPKAFRQSMQTQAGNHPER